MSQERPKCRICGLEDGACICAHLRSYPGSDELRKQLADDWRRQIINAGGDENVAQQAVALAALNGLFDCAGTASQVSSTPRGTPDAS